MSGTHRRENPFQPGAGARPPLLAGRAAELALAGELLESLERGRRPPQGLLLYGPRGNGKTVLLSRIGENARGAGLRVEELPGEAFRSRAALCEELGERAGASGTRVTGVQAAGFGVSVQTGQRRPSVSKLFAQWIDRTPTPLVILLDEAQAIDANTGRPFFDAVQSATREDRPFLLLAAGTPDAPRRLRAAGTFTERALLPVRIHRIRSEEAVRALADPARAAGMPMDGEAATLLARESLGYPYFIQLLGSAAWRAADTGSASGIRLRSARRGLAATRPVIADFYAQRLVEARERSVHRALAPLAMLLRERGGRIDDEDLDAFLEEAPVRMSETKLLETLTDLGVLWQVEPSVWEMGIPSFADHVLARSRQASRSARPMSIPLRRV